LDKSSARISQLFNQVWSSHYPRPNKVVFDNGSEFKKNFVPLLKDFSIKPTATTIKNPQSNAVVERIHQVIESMIKTQQLEDQVLDYVDPFGEFLASIAWAIRSSYHRTLEATPAQLVFGRDMIFNIKTVVNWV
jgi:transposase InsO family protein